MLQQDSREAHTDDERAMPTPIEFTPEYIEAHSPREERLYTAFLESGEPYRSLHRRDFHIAARRGFSHDPGDPGGASDAAPTLDLEDETLYYNTSGAAFDYWKDVDLPTPTKDIRKLRADLKQWGYCLIQDALSPEQLARMKQRTDDQAAGERKAGLAVWQGTAPVQGEPLPRTQFIHSLINKGRQFVQAVEHDPEGVQGGPVIEQLLNETMGPGFLMSSFIAIISSPGNSPQGLHQDQATAPFSSAAAPFTVNTMFILADTSADNGGTLVVPGSHRLTSAAGPGEPLTEPMPPAINLTAPAGTVMMFEGRLLHGTGVNRSNATRAILVMNSVKWFMRQQEMHLMSAFPEILEHASPKLLYRLGAMTGFGAIEAWNGPEFQVAQRLMIEAGAYRRVGELSPDSPIEDLAADYAWRRSESARRQAPHQPETVPEIQAKYADVQPVWSPPPGPRFGNRRPLRGE
jgi:ectoine hydroxylase-related dioxygenase (phytanoyl-CoA dioxygenase family)